MRKIKLVFYVIVFATAMAGCELNVDADSDGADDLTGEKNGEAKFEAKVSYDGQVYTFSLGADELPDQVVFMSNQVNFKATNAQQQVLNVTIAAPSLYANTSGVFRTIPGLPYAIEDKLASVEFYDATEQPLTNAASKYLIDDELVVSELSENSIILAYDGDAITGANLNNTDEGHFNLKLELSYSNFEIQDLR